MVRKLRECLRAYLDCPKEERKMYISVHDGLELLGVVGAEKVLEMPEIEAEDKSITLWWQARIPGSIFHGDWSHHDSE